MFPGVCGKSKLGRGSPISRPGPRHGDLVPGRPWRSPPGSRSRAVAAREPGMDWIADLAAGMELRQLRYFVTLAEELHFGRAAEREHIVQSALSQQVQRLERELGVRLLERSTHHVALTAAGVVFLVEARQILAHVDRAAEAARNTASASAPLRVGIIDSSYDSMPQILHEVQARYPGLVIHQVEASVPEQYQQLVRRPPGRRCRPRGARPAADRIDAVPPGPPRGPGADWSPVRRARRRLGRRARQGTAAARRGSQGPGIQPVHRRDVPRGRLHPHRLPGDRGEHPGGRRPRRRRDAACTASPPPASPRSPAPPGGR